MHIKKHFVKRHHNKHNKPWRTSSQTISLIHSHANTKTLRNPDPNPPSVTQQFQTLTSNFTFPRPRHRHDEIENTNGDKQKPAFFFAPFFLVYTFVKRKVFCFFLRFRFKRNVTVFFFAAQFFVGGSTAACFWNQWRGLEIYMYPSLVVRAMTVFPSNISCYIRVLDPWNLRAQPPQGHTVRP